MTVRHHHILVRIYTWWHPGTCRCSSCDSFPPKTAVRVHRTQECLDQVMGELSAMLYLNRTANYATSPERPRRPITHHVRKTSAAGNNIALGCIVRERAIHDELKPVLDVASCTQKQNHSTVMLLLQYMQTASKLKAAGCWQTCLFCCLVEESSIPPMRLSSFRRARARSTSRTSRS